MEISKRFNNINTSLTTEMFNQILDLENKGEKIISFTVGDPYCDISNNMKKTIKRALELETNHYTNTIGTLKLRSEIANKISKTDKIFVSKDNIIVCNGAKQCIHNLLNSVLNQSDEVIIFNPAWRAYSEMTKLAGGIPKFITLKASNNYNIDFEELENKINNKTKIIIINNPNNPTGKVMDKIALEKLIKLATKNDILLISDEVYREIVFNNKKFISLNSMINEENRKNIAVVNSISKSNAMAGWRVGYMNIPIELVKPIKILQSYSTSNINTLAQEVAIDTIKNDEEFINELKMNLKTRIDLVCNYLKKIKGINIELEPEGTFYVWVNIQKIKKDSRVFCNEILEKIHIALVPGIEFGVDGYIRISCSNSIENINLGMKKLKEYLN